MKTGRLPGALAATLVLLATWTAKATPVGSHSGVAASSFVGEVADRTEAPIDINSASEDSLRSLPGIGPARAHAIASGRPYKGKDDLVKNNIVPKNVYDGIKDRIVARQK